MNIINILIIKIGDLLSQFKQNPMYKQYLNGNENLLFIIFGIVIIYTSLFLVSALNNIPLIVIFGAILGTSLQKKYNSLKE